MARNNRMWTRRNVKTKSNIRRPIRKSKPNQIRRPPVAGPEHGETNPYFDAEMTGGGSNNTVCLTGCAYEQQVSLYECTFPAGDGGQCQSSFQTYTSYSACQADCQGNCWCSYLGQSGQSCWTPYFSTMTYDQCYGPNGASIGNIGCCTTCNQAWEGQCTCNTCS